MFVESMDCWTLREIDSRLHFRDPSRQTLLPLFETDPSHNKLKYHLSHLPLKYSTSAPSTSPKRIPRANMKTLKLLAAATACLTFAIDGTTATSIPRADDAAFVASWFAAFFPAPGCQGVSNKQGGNTPHACTNFAGKSVGFSAT